MNSLRRFFSGTGVISLLVLGATGCGVDSGQPAEPADQDAPTWLGTEKMAQASGAAAKLVIPDGAIELIADRYIVQLKDSAFGPEVGLAARAAIARDVVLRHGVSEQAVLHVYQAALNGFVAAIGEAEALQLAEDPDVELIEQDQVMTAGVTWGLDRIDQRDLPLNNVYAPGYGNGSGVHAYIIDTGIRATHTEFTGRVGNGWDFVNNDDNPRDCHGHGTHVAGTVGGTTYGAAPGVILHAVRVLNCAGSGTNSGVIAGVDWVTANHTTMQPPGPGVANMSLGGGASAALDDAVNNSVNSGVTYAVAAGNSGANACNYSPARAAAAITVGATSSTDAKASWSNYGSCLDMFAPGASITSAWKNGDSSTKTISGTSMASPHACGAAARYLSSNPGASPSQVTTALINASTSGKVTSPGSGSPNRLLYVGN